MSKSETPESLLKRIKDRRRSIRTFVKNLEPKGILLTNVNIVCSAIATFLTGLPAILGDTLLNSIGGSSPNSSSWRILCAFAALFSLVSVIVANLYKSHDIASNLNKARACDAKLEGLETLLELNRITLDDAATQYTQFLPDISFISDSSMILRDHSVLDWVKGEISQPHSSQVVHNVIHCSGWVEGVGSNLHLWLAVEIKGCIWPKEGEIFVDDDGSWSKSVHEEGATDSFSLSLFVANKKANKRVRAWLDKCDETGNYSELRRLPGLRRIARVDDLHRKMHP
jgi:hypothetical protein